MSTISAGTTSTTTLIHSGDTTGSLVLKTNDTGSGGTTAMTIDTSQNVGIGTASVVGKLTVQGSAGGVSGYFTDSVNSSLVISNLLGGVTLGTDSGGAIHLATNGYASGNRRLTIDTSGNVGIGTSSPSYKLDVRSTLAVLDGSSNIGFYANGSTYTQIWQTLQSTNDFIIQTTASKYISFGINSAEKMRIDTSGNLLVGTTSSNGRLSVDSAGATSATYAVYVRNSTPSDLLYIRSDGFFSTGGAASSPYNATTATAANVVVASNGQLQRSTSSLKYKKNVHDATHGLADLLKLRSVTYEGKAEADVGKTFGGLIAEEVDAAGLTEFVQYTEDGTPDALAYGNMVSLCIKAIQEQQALIQALTDRITALEGK